MKAYLMTQKAWAVVSGEYKKPTLSSPPTAEQLKEALEWAELNYIAVGAINLRLPNHICLLYATKINAKELWEEIEKQYGKPGAAGLFNIF